MKASLLKSISFVAFLAASSPAFAADPVVAIVDGQKITYSQVMESKSSLPKQYQSVPEEKIFPVLLNQAVDTLLINKAAQAAGEAQKPDVKKSIEKATEEIISQSYLFAQVKDVITDKAVQAKYDELIKSFPEEKEIHLRHILVDKEETAKSVVKALEGGADFKKLASTKSKDATAKEGGDLGYFRKSELPQELADAAFALSAGSYSKTPIKTDFGWHILKVDEKRDAKPPKFEEVKNELKSLLTQEAIVALLKDLRSHAKVELFDKNGKPLPAKEEKAAATTEAPAAPVTPAAPASAPVTPAPAAPAPAPAAPSAAK